MNKSLHKFLSNPEKTNHIYNNYNSFIKDNKLESNKSLKKEKTAKSGIFLKNKEQIYSLDNSLIIINSENNIDKKNTTLNIRNQNRSKLPKSKNKYLSYNNLYTNKKYNVENFKKFFQILSQRETLKDNNNDFPLNKFLSLRNISNNINESLSLIDKTYFNSLNNDEILEIINQNDFTILQKKFFENKNYIENQSNIFKIEYIKRLVRKYYYENFDNLKDFYNFINIKQNNHLTISDFEIFLKNTLKILLERKEIRYLLHTNGIININYNDFKHIFFPEQVNNKVLNLKLKNEKTFSFKNQMKLNNFSTIKANEIYDNKNENRKTLPLIDKRFSSLKSIPKVNIKIKKLKLNNEIIKHINKNCNLDTFEIEHLKENKKMDKKNKTNYILHIYKILIQKRKDIDLKFHNKKKFVKSLMKLNGIKPKKENIENVNKENHNQINQKESKDNNNINKSCNNIKVMSEEKDNIKIKNNDNNQINDNNNNIVSKENKQHNIHNFFRNENINNNHKNNIKISNKSENIKNSEINKITNIKIITEKKKENTFFSNKKKNKTIDNINIFKDSLLSLKNKNNANLFFKNEINDIFKESLNNNFIFPEEQNNKEKNLDILEYL